MEDHFKKIKMSYLLLIGFTKRTSFSMAGALLSRGEKIIICDLVTDPEKKALISELAAAGPGMVVDLLGRQTPDILDEYGVSMVLPSPGVPISIPLVAEARKRKIPVIGDIELFYTYNDQSRYIGITGTDGKTTTTNLVYEMVKKDHTAFIGGNVGIPVFEYYGKAGPDSIIVLELSSFQLETVETFRPAAAACLNIAQDHLDRYGSMNSYIDAKKNIFSNQTKDDIAVLNLDSPYFNHLKKGLKSRISTFSVHNSRADIYLKGGVIYFKGAPYIGREDIKLKGVHNVENAMAAILVSDFAGAGDNAIRETLKSFSGLEHRLEFVKKINGVEYYNDAKSTTANSLEKALLSFDSPVVLIAGGRDKGLSFRNLRRLAHKKIKKLILIGEASEKLEKELSFPGSFRAESLDAAVKYASEAASGGDVVILSPGCASFDMFRNYEERGKKFKELVNLLDM